MDAATLQNLKTATDRPTLKRAGMQFAASTNQPDLDVLFEQLSSAAFFPRLDDDRAYSSAYSNLRLGQIIKTLMDNASRPSEELRLKLTTDPVFNAHVFRMQLLLRALVPIRPSPPQAVAYWDKLSQHESPLLQDVGQAIIENESAPALALLEKKLADPGHDFEQRITILRNFLLPKRNDQHLLEMSERILRSNSPSDLKLALLEVLFDYQPNQWYRGCEVPKPPLRITASPVAKEVMRRIIQHALASLAPLPSVQGQLRVVERELGKPQQA